ncbi:MAG: sugar phosphate nucleotidyltransferase [Bacteroidales bacterium]|nr:sugar phosphate nucleotidyltransferase [Bacteroidales bacterium]
MTKPTLLILAAGMGSRYGGLKQLDGVGPCGETIMDYSVFDAIRAGFGKIVFIIRSSFREIFEQSVRERYGDSPDFVFVEQELYKIPEGYSYNIERSKPWGTGHAVLVAKDVIDTPFAVINADDYYGRHSFETLAQFLMENEEKAGAYAMVGFNVDNTLSESGSVSRGVCSVNEDCCLTGVEEHHKISREDDGIYGVNSKGERVPIPDSTLVSMNIWGFTPDLFSRNEELFKQFLLTNKENITAEYYIPYVVNEIIKYGNATCKVLSTKDQWFGVTFREDREYVVNRLALLSSEGVYPSPLFKKS